MKQKMPARGETGYAVFLTVSGRGIQFPALYRSTCRALTEGKAMEGFRVAEAEEYYPGMLEPVLVSRGQLETALREAGLDGDSAEELVCLAMNDRSQGRGVLLCRRAGRLLAAHWPPISREEARRQADWARNLHLAADQAQGVRVHFPEGRVEDLAEELRRLARNLER